MTVIEASSPDRLRRPKGQGTIGQAEAPVLELIGISKDFRGGAIRAVRNLSIDVYAGEVVSLLGPSGCGKTTTMRMIAGLEDPSGGDIRIAGRSVLGLPPHKRHIGLVFQSLAIFPHMSVWHNVAFGLRMKKVPKAEIAAKVERALDRVQLPAQTFAERMPSELSGGQLQRVALARTIVTEPALILFDEPMAALDRRLRDHMAIELRGIQKMLNIAALYVTHDQETASVMSDRIAIMRAGEIEQVGAPHEIYSRPANRFVGEFLGDINCLNATSEVQGGDAFGGAVGIANGTIPVRFDPGTVGRPLQIFVRPEHVRIHVDPGIYRIAGHLADVQFAGGFFNARVVLSDGQSLMVRTLTNVANWNKPVSVEIDGDHVLAAEG